MEDPELDFALSQGKFEFCLPVNEVGFFHFYNSCSGGGQSMHKCRGHGRFNHECNSTMLLCVWLFVCVHAIASLYLSHLKMQITDVTSMPPATGSSGGDGGNSSDCNDGDDRLETSTAGEINHAVTSTHNVCSFSVCFGLALICTAC